MRFSLFIICLTILALSGACKKKNAVGVDENFKGNWIHRKDTKHTIYLQIEADSKGYIERYENGKFNSDTQRRKWLIKKNKLYFGWLGTDDEKFSIDQYPKVATSKIIHNLDTVEIGRKYMILDGGYYVN